MEKKSALKKSTRNILSALSIILFAWFGVGLILYNDIPTVEALRNLLLMDLVAGLVAAGSLFFATKD